MKIQKWNTRKECLSPLTLPELPGVLGTQCENLGTGILLVSTSFELEHPHESSWGESLLETDCYSICFICGRGCKEQNFSDTSRDILVKKEDTLESSEISK